MSNPDHDQSQKLNSEANSTHESTSKKDKEEGVGENEENHTSGGYIEYGEEGKNSQNETGGEDGKQVHTDNHGGNSDE